MPMAQLARFAADVAADRLPESARAAAGLAILDWLACAAAGSATPAGQALASLGAAAGALPEATVVGTGQRVPWLHALVANGGTCRLLDLDDLLEPGLHPGAAVIPGALALAEARGASGAELLAAVTAGYEVAGRLVRDGGLPPGPAGAAGAAAAAARLLGLDSHRAWLSMVQAAGWAPAPGPWPAEGLPPPAPAALAGALAAWMGARGALDPSLTWADQPAAAVAAGPAGRFQVEDRTVRLHAAHGDFHAALDAAMALKEQYRLHPEDLEAVEVYVPPALAAQAGDTGPETAAALRGSLPYALAMVFGRGRVTAAEFRREYVLKGMVGWVMSITRVGAGEAAGARVVVRTRYGDEHAVAVHASRGSPGNPLDAGAVRRKFVGLAGPMWPAAAADRLADRVAHLAGLANVGELFG